jgi:pyruvate,water dikinase
MDYIARFETLSMHDVDKVGGKNSSLGEMIHNLTDKGVRVPGGFATTADAFREFLSHNGLADRIAAKLLTLNIDDTIALAEAGREIRGWMMEAPLPAGLEAGIRHNHRLMCAEAGEDLQFAVRSSATAEDLPDASFAGQQETYLNIQGADNLIDAVKRCFASLYNDRAIAYRVHSGFAHEIVALSAGIQRMVRSDLGAAGVMFTIDTESGFRDVVFINASYGLGETVVQGSVNPDEYYVHKPKLREGKRAVVRKKLGEKAIRMVFASESVAERSTIVEDVPVGLRRNFALDDDELLELARYALIIEEHYGRPMDIEWGRDGIDGKLYILQARPETVKSRAGNVQTRFKMLEKGPVITVGRAIGSKIGQGPARVIKSIDQMHHVQPGDVLDRRHDRPGLGTGHEARLRHRHQPGRPHLPRRHHRPGNGRAGGGGGGQRHPHHQGRPGSHRFLRRGRGRLRLRGPAQVREERAGHAGHAGHPGQDHDERGQPGAGLPLRHPAP